MKLVSIAKLTLIFLFTSVFAQKAVCATNTAAVQDPKEIPEEIRLQVQAIYDLRKSIGLSEQQIKDIREMSNSRRPKIKGLRRKVHDDRAALQALADRPGSDADIKKIILQLKQSQKALEAAREEELEAMERILSPTQYAKFILGLSSDGTGKSKNKKSEGKRSKK